MFSSNSWSRVLGQSKDGYRLDYRTREEFKKDVKEGTRLENELMEAWLKRVEQVVGKRPACTRTSRKGADGEYLDIEDVTLDADFEVENVGFVEVKFSKPLLTSCFHLKAAQVNSYIKQNASILMVNGTDTDSPEFALITVSMLKQIRRDCRVVNWRGFGNKKAYKIPIRKLVWGPLYV